MKSKSYGLMLLIIGSISAAGGAALAQPGALDATKGKLVVPRVTPPALDSRGNRVRSDPAVVPRGANEPVGRPGVIRDPKVIFAPKVSTEVYRICSRTVTDNCVQSWDQPGDIPNCPGDPECPE